MRLILASSSPYRRSLLERLGLPFECHSPDVDETPQLQEKPSQLAQRLAQAKAQAVAQLYPDALVIGSDQVAALGDEPIGKAGSHSKALQQLQRLSGQTVVFQTAVCISHGHQIATALVPTECRFRTLTSDEIEHYLFQDLPYDTAGSAKAEQLGIALMESLRSDDPTAIIGLPLIAVCSLLRQFGVNPLQPVATGL